MMTDTSAGKTLTLPDVQVPREVPVVKYPFMDYFKGFEKLRAVQEIFGNQTDKVLGDLEVEFTSGRFGYMGTSDEDGHMIVSAYYLKEGDLKSIYLDVIHELVHVRQFREGRELFDESYEYPDRPTELEAYKHALKEARRLSMSDDEILEYLKVTWLSDDEVQHLAKNIGIHPTPKAGLEGRSKTA